MMRPVRTRDEYMALRGSEWQKSVLSAVRSGKENQKTKLVQMNYSCLPNEDGSLKGATTMSTTVGMDIDHIAPEEMQKVKERILQKKDELGLLMLELSARGLGYHLVFKRRPNLSQEDNLRWASDLLGVDFDKGAKDITRVFFTTTEADLIYLDDEIFQTTKAALTNTDNTDITDKKDSCSEKNPSNPSNPCSNKKDFRCSFPSDYHGIPFKDIIAKYWEVNNRGFEPTQGDRDTLTYQLACDLRHICGRSFEWLDQVIPCYDGFPLEEKRAKIKSALSSEFNGFPIRLRNVLNAGADETVLIVTPDDLCIRDVEHAARIVESKSLPRPKLIVNRLDNELIRQHEMPSARTISDSLDLSLLGEIPEDPLVYRSILRRSLFIDYDCRARGAVLRIAGRMAGDIIPFPEIGTERIPLLRRLFPKTVKEVTSLDRH